MPRNERCRLASAAGVLAGLAILAPALTGCGKMPDTLFEVFFTFFEGGEVRDGETGQVIKPRYQFDPGTYHLKAYKTLDPEVLRAARTRAAEQQPTGSKGPRRPGPLRAGATEVSGQAPSRDAPPQTGRPAAPPARDR
jgi:hypothetical protein